MGPWHEFWMSGFWVFPLLMMLVMLLGIFVFARACLGRDGHGPCFFDRTAGRHDKDETPLEIAKRRLAKGEITKDEFEEIKKLIA